MTICSERLRAEIDTYGGKLVGLTDTLGRQYVWRQTYCYWPDRAGVLFPVGGRVFEGRITYAGKAYDMPLHGFAYTSEMSVKARTASSVTLALSDSDDTRRHYPFPFTLEVTYSVTGARLEVLAEAFNTGDGEMYYTLGFHPWLKVPFDGAFGYSDYSVYFPNAQNISRCVMDDGVLDTGVREAFGGSELKLCHSLFDRDAVMLSGTGGAAVIENRITGNRMTVRYDDMPYIGFWHLEKRRVKLLCVEPMTALPGRAGVLEDWTTRPDVRRLLPGEKGTASMSMEISATENR